MKFGPIDLTQPSTWRGLAGVIAVFGISASPEFTNAICIALGAVLSAIEIARNEYASRNTALLPIVLQSVPADRTVDAQQLRQPVPTHRQPAENDAGSSTEFGDR